MTPSVNAAAPDAVAGPAAAALRALSPHQLAFLERLSKSDLHAHLSGSIPLPLLQDLAREYTSANPLLADVVGAGLRTLHTGFLASIHDFFSLFSTIYALTATPAALRRAAGAAIASLLTHAEYLELRTTPRSTPYMSRRTYLECVLDSIERFSPARTALIVSLDRRMDAATAREVVALAVQLRREGRRVVGVDLCGDPTVRIAPPGGCAPLTPTLRQAGDMAEFVEHLAVAREAGLGVTVHIAEVRLPRFPLRAPP